MARRTKAVGPEKIEPQGAEEPEVGQVQQPSLQMDNMSVLELNELIERATALRDGKIGAERQAFINRIRAEAEGLGLTMQDLIATPKPERKTAGGREPAAIKYKDRETGATWTGRGRMAKVFRERLDQGRSLEEFLVKPE